MGTKNRKIKKILQSNRLALEDIVFKIADLDIEDIEHFENGEFMTLFKSKQKWFSITPVSEQTALKKDQTYCALRFFFEPLSDHDTLLTWIKEYIHEELKARPFYFRHLENEAVVDYFIYPIEFKEQLHSLLLDLKS